MIKEVAWLENKMSCQPGGEQAPIPKYPIQFLLYSMITMSSIVPSKPNTCVWKFEELRLTDTVVEVILMAIPVCVPAYSVISSQYGIEIPHNNPWDTNVLGAFLAEMIPKKCSFEWGVVAIDEGDFERVSGRWGSDFTRKSLRRGVFIDEVKLV
jgi:hypothetical protein